MNNPSVLAPVSVASLVKQNALLGILPVFGATTLSQVATGCNLLNNLITSKTQMQSRSPHFARDAIAALKVVLPGFYVTGGSGEKTIGAATTYTASIEYPAGTFTQLTFGGATSGSAPDGGMLTSDLIPVAIPKGALFWVQAYAQNASGIILKFTGLNTGLGAKLAYASSGLSDQTMSGSITNSGTPLCGGSTAAASGYAFYPCAILAQTAVQSFYLLGDSRTAGSNDAFVSAGTSQGNLARSIGPFAAYINGGVSSDTLAAFVSSHTNRLLLATMCTGVVLELSINDITAGTSLATIQGYLNTIRGYFAATVPVYLTTSEPVSAATSIAVSALTSVNNMCVATVASTANMQVGQFVTISGSTTSGYNGTFPVSQILSSTQFSYNAGATPGATTAAGTVVMSDLWQHAETQTTSAYNAVRASLNDWKRALPTGFKACLEIADVVEDGRNSGLWTNQYGLPTVDGTHAYNALYMAIQRSGAVSAATMV